MFTMIFGMIGSAGAAGMGQAERLILAAAAELGMVVVGQIVMAVTIWTTWRAATRRARAEIEAARMDKPAPVPGLGE